MALNCKPGDLAVMVRGAVEQNIGAIYEVLRLDPNRECYWLVNTTGKSLSTTGRWFLAGEVGAACDACLQPIRGLPETKEIKQTEKA